MSQKTVEAAAFKAGQAAQYLGISRRSLTEQTAAGKIAYSRISNRLFLYRKRDLDAFLDAHLVGGVA
jgi:excisionase family DNA binding protein